MPSSAWSEYGYYLPTNLHVHHFLPTDEAQFSRVERPDNDPKQIFSSIDVKKMYHRACSTISDSNAVAPINEKLIFGIQAHGALQLYVQ